jgi:hypothetical protein
MSKIAHRVISNIYSLEMTKELEDIWCNFDVGPTMWCNIDVATLDEVFHSLPFHLHIFM